MKLEERYAAAEGRWLAEVDRARQLTKESTQEHQRQMRELRTRLERLQTERDQFRQEVLEGRSELKAVNAARMQLEARLQKLSGRAPSRRGLQAKRALKRTRTAREIP
jgi:uncharacterized coiled-coil DUF342 family protein